MRASSPPPPPDPAATAAAQTGTNVSTAIANAMLGNVNQVTPDGTLTYDQTGEYSFTDPSTGESYEIPTFTATQELAPDIRAATENLNSLAADQSARLNDILGQPIDLSNDATEARIMELGRARLDPVIADRRRDLETRLVEQGIRRGSDAFSDAMADFGETENDAYNQLLLDARGQSVSEALAARNQPINEVGALLGTGQVATPNFVNAGQPQIPTTDYAGLVNQNYAQQLQNYQIGQSSRNALMGGLFGLAGGLGAAGIGAF